MNGKIRILAADDDAGFLSYLEVLLQSKGFEVDTARNGLEAREKLHTHRYDLLITDIHMPYFNGFEIADYLKNSNIRLPIIMMSSAITDATSSKALTTGAITLLKKPIDPAVLIAAINEGLSKKERLTKKDNRVLVVDDNDQFRENIVNFIRTSGYEATSVRDGASALNIAKDAKPHFDIALIDENMPDMSGHTVIAKLAQISPDTLPILISGEATFDEVGKAYSAGAFSYIRKPVDFRTLLTCLTSYERDADKRRRYIQMQNEYKKLPFYKKIYLWAKEYVDAPPNSPKNLQFRTIVISIITILLGFALLLAVEDIQKFAEETQAKFEKTTELLKEANEYERLHRDEIEREKIRQEEFYRRNKERR